MVDLRRNVVRELVRLFLRWVLARVASLAGGSWGAEIECALSEQRGERLSAQARGGAHALPVAEGAFGFPQV